MNISGSPGMALPWRELIGKALSGASFGGSGLIDNDMLSCGVLLFWGVSQSHLFTLTASTCDLNGRSPSIIGAFLVRMQHYRKSFSLQFWLKTLKTADRSLRGLWVLIAVRFIDAFL